MTVRAGREFLAIPGPTTMPDEVLQAMHRPALDIYSDQMVQAKYQVTGIGPTIAGHNGGGDLYYTDGEIWVLRLVEACKKREGPAVTIPSPPATELKDQIWRAIADTVAK